jgi:site-specific recombinase XerD
MTRPPENHLTVYRRHAKNCKAKKDSLDNCQCPFYMHGTLGGNTRVRKCLDTRSHAAAVAKRDRYLERGTLEDEPPEGIHKVIPIGRLDVSVEDAVKEFIAWGRRKERTRKIYRWSLGGFCNYLHERRIGLLREVDAPHVDGFLKSQGWSDNSQRGALDNIRQLFGWCVKSRRWISFSPAEDKGLSIPKPDPLRMPFTLEEISRIVAAIERMTPKSRDRARAAALLLLYTGMRVCDVAFAEREYLTPSGAFDYWMIKTGRPITAPPQLHQDAIDALSALSPSRIYYFQPDAPDDYREARLALRTKKDFESLMPGYRARVQNIMRHVKGVLRLAGITGKGCCHRFRDTFAISMLLGGQDVFTVSRFLGHRETKTTEGYLKLVPEYRERLSAATRCLNFPLPIRLVK